MDFGTLLQTAKENEHQKREVRYYSTKFSAPKKEEKKAKSLSANIQKFLARKEAEEKERARDVNKKRDELLALRSKDKKATRRVNVMLKRTKSANQSVIEDAVDKDNTAVTLAGPSQPDEDDYGYVSQEAAAYYNKMMEKYNKMPDDPKFSVVKKKASSNLSSTKDRVKAALEKEKEDALLPHRRKRKHKEQDNQTDESDERRDDTLDREDRSESSVKVKPKSGGPPPMNFSELLKLAAQKHREPIIIEVKPKEEEGPLMTKKQKKEYERVQQWKDSKKQNDKVPLGKSNSDQVANRIPKLSSAQPNNHKLKETGDRQIPKSNGSYKNNEKIDKRNIQGSYNNIVSKSELPPSISQNVKVRDKDSSILKNVLKTQKSAVKSEVSSSKLDPTRQKSLNDLPKRNPENLKQKSFSDVAKKNSDINLTLNKKSLPLKGSEKNIPTPKSASSSSIMQSKSVDKSMTNTSNSKKDLKYNGNSKEFDKPKPAAVRQRELPPKRFPPDDLKRKQFPPKDMKAKQFPPPDVRRKEFPPADVRRKEFPPADVRRKEFPPADVRRKEFPPADVRRKEFPPADVRRKEFPPADVRRKEFPPKDLKRKPQIGSKRRILDDDDEDYDSEMDDFIDDGPEEMEDYSKYIKDIFGYDKSRYRGMDEDDIDNMESTFAQQMREDIRSTKLGIMEDLEDIQREKDEKRRKDSLKKKRKL